MALFLLSAFPGHAQAVGPHAEADAYLARASSAMQAKDTATARLLIDSALELSPDYSEALYARASLELADRSSTNVAIADLQRALAAGTWEGTDASDAARSLGAALLRTGRPSEARVQVERSNRAHPEDYRNLLLGARVSAALRDTTALQTALAEASARFPDVDELRLLSARLLERQGKRPAALDLVSTGLRFHPDSLPLLLASAALERNVKRALAAADLYAQKGGTDPEAALIGLQAAPPAEARRYLDLFIANGGLSRQDLIERAAAAVSGTKALQRLLQDALSAYSGTRDLDADSDGFWEERWTLDKGGVTAWTREPRQDGVAEYAATFVAGKPATLSWIGAAGTGLTAKYSSYPYVESITQGGAGTWVLVPYELQCPFLQPVAAPALSGLTPHIATRLSMPSLEKINASAYRLDEFSSSGVLVRRTELSRGLKVFMQEDGEGNGSFNHKVWFTNGMPDHGERTLPGSPTFAVKETWKNGALASESVDTDADGRPDFRQSFGVNPVKSWDYNEDGIDDSRERSSMTGEVIRELSTALNGVFDLSIAYRGTTIERVTQSGVVMPVTQDGARGVTWIGTPAPGGKPDVTLPDGIQTIGGRAFLVFRHEGILYAEALK
jgi:tetratricopeptide (TPR) repeat protein